MPMFKSAPNAHNGCYNIWYYLTKKDRALAQDVLNVRSQLDRALWYKRFDRTRAQYGNDAAYNGKKAVTYYHFVISPDPKDAISLERLRELAKRWAAENFPDAEVAIVYHDDNDLNIHHAHVVVNNTNLRTGRRIQINDKMNQETLPNSLQRIAHEMGLSVLPEMTRGRKRTTSQLDHRKFAERGITAAIGEGKTWKGPSWVAQIRETIVQISTEVQGPLSFGEFQERMRARGYDVYMTKRGYTYAHPDGYMSKSGEKKNWKIRDINLGARYTPYGMARLHGIGAEQPLAKSMFREATAREAAAYRQFRRTWLDLLNDVSMDERLEAYDTIVSEGVHDASDYARLREDINGRIERLDMEVSSLDHEIAEADGLMRALAVYEERLPVANRLAGYSLSPTAPDAQARDDFLAAHAQELEELAQVRNELAQAGIGDEAAAARFREAFSDMHEKHAVKSEERLDLESRCERLVSAEAMSLKVRAARTEAQKLVSLRYSNRKDGPRAGGTVVRRDVVEKVSLRTNADAQGRAHYEVVRQRQVRFQMSDVAQSSSQAHRAELESQRARSALAPAYDVRRDEMGARNQRERNSRGANHR